VQESAFVEVQERVAVPPGRMEVGEAVILTDVAVEVMASVILPSAS
jgi:hypothetical protein